jgi:hypothetical protein
VTGPDGVLREHTLDIDELMKLATDRLTRTMTLTECETFLRSPGCASYVRSETGSR